MIFLDPMLPLGLLGPRLTAAPYVVVVHGAEITVPGRLPGSRQLGAPGAARRRRRRRGGTLPGAARRSARPGDALRGVVIPPGVDVERFRPLRRRRRAATPAPFGLDPDRPLVLGVSRLVPRKGFDVLIDAVAGLPDVQLAIAGAGPRPRAASNAARDAARDRDRVRFLGRVPDADSFPRSTRAPTCSRCGAATGGAGSRPRASASCSSRRRRAGVPAVAGRSGGSHEAVVDGETGFVVDGRALDVRGALAALLADDDLRRRMGAARTRARSRSSPTTRSRRGSRRSSPATSPASGR